MDSAARPGALPATAEERVVIVAPVGQDAPAMASMLFEAGFRSYIAVTLLDCARQLEFGAGALLLTEEALENPQLPTLLQALTAQPAWSELPVIILTSGGESRMHQLLDQLSSAAGVVTLLERPMSRATLYRSAEVALRSRRRQYQVRDLLAEQGRAREQFQQSEARLSAIFAQAPVGLSEISLEGRFLRGNPELCRILGLAEGALSTRSIADVTHPDDRAKIAHALGRAVATGESITVEKRCLSADGAAVWTSSSVTPLRSPAGDPVSVLAVTADVTARKRAETALRESEERLRLIIENAREYAIFSMDLERRITSWNAGAQAILGYSASEIVGTPGDIIFTPEDRAAGGPQEEAGTALRHGRAMDERWHLCASGRRFWGSGVMMAMRDGGEPIGFVKIFRDQTQEMQTRQALERSQSELRVALEAAEKARQETEAAGKAKDQFLAVLSHELRTPLTPVIMAVHALSRRKDLPDAVHEALAMVRRNVQLETQLIDDLLDVTRIARGKLEIVRHPMKLQIAIERAVEVVHGDIEAKGQRLELTLAAPEISISGDSVRLQQVFWNLLKNASKFTPVGGFIQLRSRLVADPAARRIVVEVSDTGIGFEADAAERIFGAFAQGSQDITREFGGLGLGLAISKATVEAHGGTLRATSDGPGTGACFIVELPLD